MTSLIGRMLGPYEIRDVIGHGGMASVYLGYRADVDRTVAIKVLPPHPGLNDDAKQRFQLEARTIANLQHPHILPLYDYGATDDSVLYLVMPYVRGGSLDRVMRDGAMPVKQVERTVREISSALDYAHRQGVIHRDIKPANILLDGEGNALLADFGIVKLTGGDSNLTGTSVVGTPAYMSPEQAQGFELSARADVYSFGVVVYELLAGRQPFTSESVMNLMLKHITDDVPDVTGFVPALPEQVNAVMNKVLAKQPEDRYQTATVFSDALSRSLQHAGPQADFREQSTVRVDTPQSTTPVTGTPPSTPSTPSQPIQIQLPNTTAPITLPIDPSDPNRPGTIVIQQSAPANNAPLVIGFGLVSLIAVAALVIVLISLSSRTNNPPADATADAATQQVEAVVTPPGTAVAVVESRPTFGRVSFSSSTDDLRGDTINFRVQGFQSAPSGQMYVASLLNTESGERLSLGRVTVDAVGSGALTFTDGEGRFLPSMFNAVTVSLEQNGSEPTFEDVRYSAHLPLEMLDAMHEIFIETEGYVRNRRFSLLQAAILDGRFVQQHAGLTAGADSLPGRRTHNEHTLNIVLGGAQNFDGNERGDNPGLGVGLLTTLDRINEALSRATSALDAPPSIQSEAELIRVCLQNVRDWANEIIQLEHSMLAAADFEATHADAAASVVFADRLEPGFDQNENGIVEPFEGECGLEQIGTFGLVIASLDLAEGPIAILSADSGNGE